MFLKISILHYLLRGENCMKTFRETFTQELLERYPSEDRLKKAYIELEKKGYIDFNKNSAKIRVNAWRRLWLYRLSSKILWWL